MVDTSRVVNLPNSPTGPDSSGVGRLLFDRANQRYEMGEQSKQLDVLEGIRQKYKASSMAQANAYDQSMEQLRSGLSQARTNVAWQHEQDLRQKSAGAIGSLIGGAASQGIAMPGLAKRTGDMEQGAATGVPQFEVPEVSPDALDTVRSTYAQNILEHLRRQGKLSDLDVEVQKKNLFEKFDLVDDETSNQIKDLASQLRIHGDIPSADYTLSMFGTPGRGSKTAAQKWMTDSVPKLQIAQAGNARHMAVAKEITQRTTEIAKLRVDASSLLNKARLEDIDRRRLGEIHSGLSQRFARLNTLYANTVMEASVVEGPQAVKLNGQIIQIKQNIADVQTHMATIEARMEQDDLSKHGGAVSPNQLAPTTTPKDPLGILGGR